MCGYVRLGGRVREAVAGDGTGAVQRWRRRGFREKEEKRPGEKARPGRENGIGIWGLGFGFWQNLPNLDSN